MTPQEREELLRQEATRGLVLRPGSRLPVWLQRLIERVLIGIGRRLG